MTCKIWSSVTQHSGIRLENVSKQNDQRLGKTFKQLFVLVVISPLEWFGLQVFQSAERYLSFY